MTGGVGHQDDRPHDGDALSVAEALDLALGSLTVDHDDDGPGAHHVAVAEPIDGGRRRQALEDRRHLAAVAVDGAATLPAWRSATRSRVAVHTDARGVDEALGEHGRRAAVVAVAQDDPTGTEHHERVRRTGPRRAPTSAGRRAGGSSARPPRRPPPAPTLSPSANSTPPAASTARPWGPSSPGGDSTRWVAGWRLLGDAAVDEVRHEDAVVGADRDVVDAQRHLGQDLPWHRSPGRPATIRPAPASETTR